MVKPWVYPWRDRTFKKRCEFFVNMTAAFLLFAFVWLVGSFLSRPRCLRHGDPRLHVEMWVDANRTLIYQERCRCYACRTHLEIARNRGRCSQHCGRCFDALWGA